MPLRSLCYLVGGFLFCNLANSESEGTIEADTLIQILKQIQDEKSDQFGFCSTLYYALYGYRAFSGTTASTSDKPSAL